AIAAVASVPGACTPCTSASESIHGIPRRRNRSSTWLLPVAIPPVSPIFSIVRSSRRSSRAFVASEGGLALLFARLKPRAPLYRRRQSVLEEHRDRQRTDTAGDRRQRAGDVRDLGMHVADDERSAAPEGVAP